MNPKYTIEILRALDYHFPINKKIILFGSRARGTNKIGSNIDIAIDTGQPISFTEMAQARVTLENLIVPFIIDLVDMHNIPDELKQIILEEGIKLKIALKLLHKALATLDKALNYFDRVKKSNDKEAIESADDSIIKRFEYSYDAFWKFLKKYLELRYNLEDVNSPKSIFRACVKHDLCSPEQGELLLTMVNDRNETTHNYDIEKVRSILPKIPKYYTCMVAILKNIED